MSLNHSAYRDGSLGFAPPPVHARRDGVLGMPPVAQARRDGVLGGMDGVLGGLGMAQPVAFRDGSLGFPQPVAFRDGSLGWLGADSPAVIAPGPAVLKAAVPTMTLAVAGLGALAVIWWAMRKHA